MSKFEKGSPEAYRWAARMKKARRIRKAGKKTERAFFGVGSPLEVKKPMIRVSTSRPIGYEIADVGAGGKLYNVKSYGMNPGSQWAKEIANSLNLHLLGPVPYHYAYTSGLGGPDRVSVLLTFSLDPKEQWLNGILENSRYAKFHIYDNTIELISKYYTLPKFRKSRFKDTQGLFDILQKWIRLAATSMQENPITVVGLGNPPNHVNARVEGILYNRCIEIRAEKTSRTGLKGLYYHPFLERSQVCILALDNGDLLIHSKTGEKLWKLD